MVFLIIRTKSFQNLQSLLCGRFLHSYRLESSLQCRIFLNMLAVLFQCGCSDKLNLSSGKGWFQNIRCIQCTFRATGTDNGMDLINKQKDSLMFPYFLNYILNTFLKFSSVLASCHHAGKIQYHQTFVFYRIWHHTHYDPLRKSFCDSSFSYPWFSYKARIVLRSSA